MLMAAIPNGGAKPRWRVFFSFPHESVDSIFEGINSAEILNAVEKDGGDR